MRIKQAYVGVGFFKESFLKKYKLREYDNRFNPSIFFGLYRKQQHILTRHRSIAVIVWAGTDVIHMKNNKTFLEYVKNRKDVFHVAISSFIEKDLNELDIPYVSLPVIPQDNFDFKPEPLGNCIYMYTSKKSPEIYGEHYLNEIKRQLPTFKFIVATAHCYTREQLKDIYKKCFVGLRLTKHDGLSNTCVELGLMGRKVIWNGNTPNALPYRTINNIVASIKKESKKIGQTDHDLATKVKSYLELPDDWLNISYYMEPKYEASVIINTYKNDIIQLKAAIESYLMQQQVKVQIIISTAKGDSSIQIAKSYGLECCVSETPGIYQQLNKAIKLVKNEWFAYASGNDIASPTKMIEEIECCIENKKKICYSNFYHTDENLKVTKTTNFYKYNYQAHLKGNFVNDCATIHKSILDKYMPFKEEWGNYAYWDLWLRVYKGEGDVFWFNPNPTWYYRVSQNSKHVKRAKKPKEVREYKNLKYKMLRHHAERERMV